MIALIYALKRNNYMVSNLSNIYCGTVMNRQSTVFKHILCFHSTWAASSYHSAANANHIFGPLDVLICETNLTPTCLIDTMKDEQKSSLGEVTINIDISFSPVGFEPLDEEMTVSFPVQPAPEEGQQVVVPMTTARLILNVAQSVRLNY